MAANTLRRLVRVSPLLRTTIKIQLTNVNQNFVQARPTILMTSSFHSSISRYSSVINVQDEEDFKSRVLDSNVPVVVDFHANWCGPCKLLGPRLETLIGAENLASEKVILAKVDIDEMPDLAMEYGVEAVPTVIAVKDGKQQSKFVGLKEDDEIESFIKKLMG